MARLQGFVGGCLREILGVSRWDNMRNTQLRAQAGIERIDVMILQRRLRWLSHTERMKESRLPKYLLVCRPARGKRSVGGQKRRWNEVVKDDLKKCDLLADWRDVASQREAWKGVVKIAANKLNQQLELSEKEKKDQLKKRREAGVQSASYAMSCDEPGCSFTSISNAGLTNHKRQKHGPAAQLSKQCIHCHQYFQLQGFSMHVKHCRGRRQAI
jgi:hypothetical protein